MISRPVGLARLYLERRYQVGKQATGSVACELRDRRGGMKVQIYGAVLKPSRAVPHFDKVDKSAIRAQFFDGRKHRASLLLPFVGRAGRTLCVIGQNPSAADEHRADRTIRYLEELIYSARPEYSALLVLNLYSRVDTTKSEKGGLLNGRCAEVFDAAIEAQQDFLLVYGRLRNEGAYRFLERAKKVSKALKSKKVLKLDLNTPYPPHPGNSKILYRNLSVQLTAL